MTEVERRAASVTVTPAARRALAAEGCTPEDGARPLARAVRRSIVDRLAAAELAGELRATSTVTVDAVDGAVTVEIVTR